jgi:hypothetical protein
MVWVERKKQKREFRKRPPDDFSTPGWCVPGTKNQEPRTKSRASLSELEGLVYVCPPRGTGEEVREESEKAGKGSRKQKRKQETRNRKGCGG